jgi:DNA-binding SARP family transcriptional activator
LRSLQTELALLLGSALEAADREPEAIALYEQLITRDELQEEPHRRLLACWARAGDRPRALRHYQRLTEVLRTVLDAEPEHETVALYERIRAAEPV